jgi:PAS domain S-box-containing protein
LALKSHAGLAFFWPAGGIAIGALIVLGPAARLPVTLGMVFGSIACSLTVGRSPGLAVAFAVPNASEALLTAWLVQRWFGATFKLEEVSQVLGFLVASAIAVAVGAACAAIVVSFVEQTLFTLQVWRVWFSAGLLGTITVAPLLIELAEAVREVPPRRELVEGVAALVTLAALSAFLISVPQGPWATALPVALVLPLLLWVAVRCRPVFAAAAMFVVTLAVVWSATFHRGHFGDASIPLADRILAAQTLVLAGTLLALVLAALFSERRQSETTLQKSKERLQLALDGAELGAFSADLTTDLLECDARTALIHGHNVLPVTLKESRRFVHPDDLVRIDNALAEAQRNGGAWRAEYRMVPPPGHPHAGETRWIAVESSIVRNPRGTAVRLLGVTRDITHQKRAEEALAERNAQLALAGTGALVGSYGYDVDSGEMQVSAGYAAIHGLPEGTTETTRREWRDRVHPDDIGRLDGLRSHAFGKRGYEYNVEYRIVLPDRSVRWIESRSFISYNADGCAQRVIGVNIDITERKHIEALLKDSKTRLADALAAGQVMAFEWDAVTGLSERSENAAQVLGSEPRGKEFIRHVHADDRKMLKAHIHDLSRGNPSYTLEFRYIGPDSREVWLEETAKGEFDATGKLVRIKGLTRDITERKRAEERQCVLVAELDHRVKNALATVSAVVSHTRQGSRSVANFAAAIEGRIHSMAATHELLSSRQWQGLSLADLVRRELAPYATRNNTEINGPAVLLRTEAGQAMAMVLHELATNAAKYGALTNKNGRVSVRWDRRLNGHPRSLVLEWQEIGGPPIVAAGKSGYGTSTIRNLIPYEFGGTVDLVFAPEGVRCRLELSGDWLSNESEPVSEALTRRARAGAAGGEHER